MDEGSHRPGFVFGQRSSASVDIVQSQMTPGDPSLATLDIRHLVVRPPDVHPGEANGVVGVARELVREQCGLGERARLVMLAHGNLPPDEGDVPTDVLPLEGFAIRGRVVRLRRDVVAALLSGTNKATVFHLHGGREPLLAGLGRTLRSRGLPYVVTLHGRLSHVYDEDGRCQKPSTALYLRLLERDLLEGALFVQALSPDEAGILRRIAPRARVEIVGNGAYSARGQPFPSRPEQRIPSAAFPHFVFCGRYAILHKGLDLLLEGYAQYRKTGGTGWLTTIGTGPDRAVLVEMAERLGVADALDIRGPLFGGARDKALQTCDFFIMPSRFEGVPLAALEAALLGLPLIVSSGTGLRAPVQTLGAGVPIERLSAAAVSAAMHRASKLSPAGWAACRDNAFSFAIAIGDWTTIARRLRALYTLPADIASRPSAAFR